jgi:UDP-N-acetylmuramoyl-tripeptide--D-alanyl-D-alanine ligase
MLYLTFDEILKATNGNYLSKSGLDGVDKISTDSRDIKPGCLFIPLVGNNFDGHDFIRQAFEAGAEAALTHKPLDFPADKTVIRVENTSRALLDLAGYYRQRFNIPVVAITGSVGKTSTKDFVACVLGKKYNVLKTAGNYNNEIGLPLTIFNLDEKHQAAVLEMGMSALGEISRLTAVARPDVAIITNVGISHIEKLGSKQNILKAKLEILEGLDKEKGLLLLNGEDGLLKGLRGLLDVRTVFYGMDEDMDYRATNITSKGEFGASFDIVVEGREYTVDIKIPGAHNVKNALAAIAAGRELGVPMDQIVSGIAECSGGKMRMDVVEANGFRIINDAYNACPQSAEAALRALADFKTNGRRIAVLGDMLELGSWAADAHAQVGKAAFAEGVDMLVAVGENAKYTASGAIEAGIDEKSVAVFGAIEEAARFIQGILPKDDIILIKGSRGMKMEALVEKLKYLEA